MNSIAMYSLWYRHKPYFLLALLLSLAITGGIIAFPLTYVTNTNVLLGTCLLPFSLFIHGRSKINYYYLTCTLLFMILVFLYNVRIFYFFALALYIIFLLEWKIGRVGHLVLFLIIFMSPFFEQVAVILGFPIRIYLSTMAASILSLANMDVQVSGNMMQVNGTAFTVDDACMGLHLLSVSLLMGVFMLTHRYRAEKRYLSLFFLTMFFLHVLVLNVLSNLFRIAILVAFRIMPENPMHEVIGIMCLVVYVIVPIYFLSGWMVRRFGKAFSEAERKHPVKFNGKLIAMPIGLLIVWLGFHINDQRRIENFTHANVSLGNLSALKMEGGVTKFFDHDFLVYVKPIPEFFSGEHTPLICWKGSGYQFNGVKKVNIGGHEIYMGTLVKSDARLCTAWWYDNGEIVTIDQMEWRMRMLKGEDDFCLVNVTAESESTLIGKVQDLFNNHLLNIYE